MLKQWPELLCFPSFMLGHCTVDEYKHLGCQSDKIKCSRQESTWVPMDHESKTLPLDQQVKHREIAKLEVLILCPEICPVIERFFIFCECF